MEILKTGRIVELNRGANGVACVLAGGARCRIPARVAAASHFWLKPGQLIEVVGVDRGGVWVAEEVHLLDDAPAPGFNVSRETCYKIPGGFVPRYGRAGAVARIVADVWEWVTGK